MERPQPLWERLEDLARTAPEETAEIDFKQSFDRDSTRAWCELIKDFVAMANSGGGALVIGVTDNGQPSLFDAATLETLDPAVVSDKLKKYIGRDFANFRLRSVQRNGRRVFAFLVGPSSLPIVLVNPGTYSVGEKQQNAAFNAGALVFRHGAKSEPASADDVRLAFERELERVRRTWMDNIRRVVEAPEGTEIRLITPVAAGSPAAGAEAAASVHPDQAASAAVRITTDPSAPVVRGLDPNVTHPFRQKELMQELRKSLDVPVKITEFQAVRARLKLDDNPAYIYRPNFSSPRYSTVLLDWLVDEARKDPAFFARHYEATRGSPEPGRADQTAPP